MVRPERRVVLAGASPVRVSAGAPGSRPQPGGETRSSGAECQEPLEKRRANRRAATLNERNRLVRLSPEGVWDAEPLISRRRQQTSRGLQRRTEQRGGGEAASYHGRSRLQVARTISGEPPGGLA